ncbi:MAG TPA: tautomerase family protein [Sporichthyaceae bacterium]|jgi:phenylpyruvate tautomerase PptA (4-oxalocrotonate tautomerase family)|nr:tautomerase family protein [Sporichthyaceae bacterium]
MPIYTCTTTTATLDARSKKDLAAEITRIHAEINHVPSAYINVVFHEVPAENLWTDSVPAGPLLVKGWVRQGHPAAETTRLALEIADACSRLTGVPKQHVLVVIENSPAHGAVEGGTVLPEPGGEAAWIVGQAGR